MIYIYMMRHELTEGRPAAEQLTLTYMLQLQLLQALLLLLLPSNSCSIFANTLIGQLWFVTVIYRLTLIPGSLPAPTL